MVKKKEKHPEGYISMGIINFPEGTTQEEIAEMNRKFRRSRGMLEW